MAPNKPGDVLQPTEENKLRMKLHTGPKWLTTSYCHRNFLINKVKQTHTDSRSRNRKLASSENNHHFFLSLQDASHCETQHCTTQPPHATWLSLAILFLVQWMHFAILTFPIYHQVNFTHSVLSQGSTGWATGTPMSTWAGFLPVYTSLCQKIQTAL